MSSQPSQSKIQKGFTLVELLVVIGIIAALISMLLPALQSARQAAYQVNCAANMKQVYVALVAYTQDYRGFTPPLCYADKMTPSYFRQELQLQGVPGTGFPYKNPAWDWMRFNTWTDGINYYPGTQAGYCSSYLAWPSLLWPYHKNNKIYICPNANYKDAGWTYQLNWNFCPIYFWTGAWFPAAGTYPLVPYFPDVWSSGPSPQIKNKLGSFQYKTDKILLTDGREGMAKPTQLGDVFDTWWYGLGTPGGKWTNGVTEWPVTLTGGNNGGIDANHYNKFANCLMLDGSVQSFSKFKHYPLNDWNTTGHYHSWFLPTIPSWTDGT